MIIQHKFQCSPDGLTANLITPAIEMMLYREGFMLIAETDADSSHRIPIVIPAGTGKTCDRNRHIRLEHPSGTNGHFLRCL